jgi:hypothetical protein
MTARCTGLCTRRSYPGRDLANQGREWQQIGLRCIVRENDHGQNSERNVGQDQGRAEISPESVGESREGCSSALGGLCPQQRSQWRRQRNGFGIGLPSGDVLVLGTRLPGPQPRRLRRQGAELPGILLVHNQSGLRHALLPPGHASVSTGNGMPAVPPLGECKFGVPLEAARFRLPREGTGEDIPRVLSEVRR